ncbi:hypothetical protein RFI_17062, partial [Reticulomyxa filosa]
MKKQHLIKYFLKYLIIIIVFVYNFCVFFVSGAANVKKFKRFRVNKNKKKSMTTPVSDEGEITKIKEDKKERLRLCSVKELVETEQSYVNDLETVTKLYIEPLANNEIISQEYHGVLFKEIPALMKLNHSFCASYAPFMCVYPNNKTLECIVVLVSRFEHWDPNSSKIGDHFLQYAPFFNIVPSPHFFFFSLLSSSLTQCLTSHKIKLSYLNVHEMASALRRRLYDTSPPFKDFCDKACKECNGLDLSSYLSKPFQRILKYKLLLQLLNKTTVKVVQFNAQNMCACKRAIYVTRQEILKYTKSAHPDLKDITLALEKITEVWCLFLSTTATVKTKILNNRINEKMKEHDSRMKVRDIEMRLQPRIELVAPARKFVREGKLTKVCRKSDQSYQFILFNDLLLYGHLLNNQDKSLKVHRLITIDSSFRVRDIPQNSIYGTKCFEIHSPEKSFIVYGDHPGLFIYFFGKYLYLRTYIHVYVYIYVLH